MKVLKPHLQKLRAKRKALDFGSTKMLGARQLTDEVSLKRASAVHLQVLSFQCSLA